MAAVNKPTPGMEQSNSTDLWVLSSDLINNVISAVISFFCLVKRQLTSYAGLDVKEKQSGTSVKGKPKISKKGNRFLRKALHLPALCAIRSNEKYKIIFIRLVGKHGIKMKAAVAIQRKLLEMMYTLFKADKKYDINHFRKTEVELAEM